MKIKCYGKIECEVCHVKGILQVFLDKECKAKYGRIRHREKIDNKTQFTYHPQSLSYINQKINLNLCNGDQGQKEASFGHFKSSSVCKLEPSAGFGPATITLPSDISQTLMAISGLILANLLPINIHMITGKMSYGKPNNTINA
jgi:hypothetical protein